MSVFFRDDDAGWSDDRLRRLLDEFARRSLPLDLAVIPQALGPELAHDLRERADDAGGLLGLHQHGLAHANHEASGRPCEFGPSRSRARQLLDIERGRARLEGLLDGRVDPIFTPPWNRCTRETADCLLELGFTALSRESRAEPVGVPGLHELSVHVDWFARRKGVRLSRSDLGSLLAAAGEAGGPVGVMFHHAEMDAAERAAAAELLDLLAGHPQVRCARMCDLLAGVPA